MENTKIARLSVEELDKVIKIYPWFSLARRELFLKMSLLGNEYREEGLKKVAPYMINTRAVARVKEPVLEEEVEVRKPAFSFSDSVEVLKPKEETKIHVVGGDYFSKEDFVALEDDALSVMQRIKVNSDIPCEQPYELEVEENFWDTRYYTETLAKIYTNQAFYTKAIEVYEKLILLYPKKNVYFASLIKELQKHL